MVFIKGVSGNPAGRPKRKTLTELLHEKLDKDGGWDNLVEAIMTLAKRKDKDIIKEIWKYTDGLPTQRTDITTDGEKLEGLVIIKDGSSTK